MRVALLNPRWDYAGSIYFGCREPHLPLELGCCRVLLQRAGHEVLLLDAHLQDLDDAALHAAIRAFAPQMTVLTTAPTYLFWRCAPPELRVPRQLADLVRDVAGLLVAVGPHGSVTPGATLAKLGVDVVVRGECEEVVLGLAEGGAPGLLPGTAMLAGHRLVEAGGPQASRFTDLPALDWPADWLARHCHHHHRFEAHVAAPGAEVEASRGCPYACSFCAKIDFRDAYRKRDLAPLLQEIDGLVAHGVRYVYFIDEIFLPRRDLLEALVSRPLQFGIQTRIDLWSPEMLALLGRAGCVSVEAGVESLTVAGRAALTKRCRLTTDELAERLILARAAIPFVQANLIASADDDAGLVAAWRERLLAAGIWANDPVPLYPYPSSPDYRRLWGPPDDHAWERAHAHYLGRFAEFSDIQDDAPLSLTTLEAACVTR